VKRVTSGDEPAISRDGSTLIYVGGSGGGTKFPWIYAINADGTQRRRLASPDFEVSNPVWEQGGGALFAYVGDLVGRGQGQKDEGRQIFVSDVSGEARQLTHDEEPGRDISYEPSFAPNSNRIVFTHLSSRGSDWCR
jgi:Tol biopolymer transport system component